MFHNIQKMPLKDMDPSLLTLAIIDAVEKMENVHKETIVYAISVASYLHRKQRRKNRKEMPLTFYIEHPLRNAMRAIRWGVTDQDILVAIILHDTVEDCVDEIVKETKTVVAIDKLDEALKRQIALDWLKRNFSRESAFIVRELSNPIRDESIDLTREESNAEYVAHAGEAIRFQPKVFIGKLVDVIDNGSGLRHLNRPQDAPFRLRSAIKYRPLIDIFEEVLNDEEWAPEVTYYLSEHGVKSIRKHLEETRTLLDEIIASAQPVG